MTSAAPPATLGAEQTLGFVRESAHPGRLLEVGCGDGELAAMLAAWGYDVVAVDADPASVESANRRGVKVQCCDFLRFDCPPVDAVLFTRSLHHIADAPAAVRHARALLRPHGRVLVDDFGVELVTATAATWLYDLLALATEACGVEHATTHAHPDDALRAWRAAHPADHIHSSETLDRAIRSEFESAERRAVPYLYRYVDDVIRDARARPLARAAMRWEERLVARGSIPCVGQRWLCS